MVVFIPEILVVGLGNLPFPKTRHSIGQLLVDALAAKYDIRLANERGGFFGKKEVNMGDTFVALSLFKSKSLMNISGPSIAQICRKTVLSPKHMIVLSDSLSHKPQAFSPRLGGSANGHNGLKSVISALGGEHNFYQFRLGVGQDRSVDAAEYVLTRIPQVEQRYWHGEGMERILKEMENVAKKQAMP